MALGYALEDRTLSAGVELLPVGTALVANRSLEFRRVYPDLQAGLLIEATDEELVEELDSRFTDAIRIRTMGSRGQRQVAFLSGGMDSRAIVSKLIQLGEQVTTINVAPPGTMDAELGGQAASRLGSRYRHFDLTNVTGRLGVLLQQATQKVWAEEETKPSARSVWSGDGGSVILGAVYLTQSILDLAMHHKWNSVARHLLDEMGAGIPRRLLRRDHRERAGPAVIDIVESMIRRLNSSEAQSESPYLFLLRTDQRRHLHRYYSESGPGDYEPIVPFFDSELVDWVVQVPVDRKLNHELYHNWYVSGALTPAEEVPWQTYPGHEPCPLPLPDGLPDQWSHRSAWYPERMQRKIGRRTALQAARAIRSGSLPNSQLNMPYASIAITASLIGIGRWRYVPEVLTRLAES
jgi:asparagine synthetase B (glutamine-hydrolysing)